MGKKSFQWVEDFFDTLPGLPEQSRIAERLKRCSDAMQPVYAEIEKKVTDKTCPRGKADMGRRGVLAAIVDSAVVYEEKLNIKNDKKDLTGLQKDITKTVDKLVSLLNSYYSLKEYSYINSEARLDPLYLIEEAGKKTGPPTRKILFSKHIVPILKKIDGGLRMGKYQPSFQDVLNTLASQVDCNPPIGARPEIDSILDSRKTSSNDFIRGFMDYIEREKLIYNLPEKFKMTDDNLAAIVGVLYGDHKRTDSIRKARAEHSRAK